MRREFLGMMLAATCLVHCKPASRVHLTGPWKPGNQQLAATNANHLNYYGGEVLSNVKVTAVLWGAGVSSDVQTKIEPFYKAVFASDYMDWLSEYNTTIKSVNGANGTQQHIGRGTFDKLVQISPSTTALYLSDVDDIQKGIAANIASGALPAIEANSLYVVYLPPNVQVKGVYNGQGFTTCVDVCSYHESFVSNGQKVRYAVVPDQGSGGCANKPNDPTRTGTICGPGATFENTTSLSSHEMIEAVTDPDPPPNPAAPDATTGWHQPLPDAEIADICGDPDVEPKPQATINGVVVQKMWSNALNKCIVDKCTTADNKAACQNNQCGFAINRCGDRVACGVGDCPAGRLCSKGACVACADLCEQRRVDCLQGCTDSFCECECNKNATCTCQQQCASFTGGAEQRCLFTHC